MIGRDAMRRYFVSLLLLLIGTSLAFAQPFYAALVAGEA